MNSVRPTRSSDSDDGADTPNALDRNHCICSTRRMTLAVASLLRSLTFAGSLIASEIQRYVIKGRAMDSSVSERHNSRREKFLELLAERARTGLNPLRLSAGK